MSGHEHEPARVEARMTTEEVDGLLTAILQSRRLRAEALPLLKPEHFGAGEAGHAIVYQAARELGRRRDDDEMLPELDLTMEACRVAAARGLAAGHTDWDEALAVPGAGARAGLIHHAYHDAERGQFSEDAALGWLKRFLRERAIYDRARDVIRGPGHEAVPDLSRFMVDLQAEEARIAALGGAGMGRLSRVDWSRMGRRVLPTKVPFFDDFMGGGIGVTEIAGLLGGTGWGKSTLARQVGIQAAQHFQAAARPGQRPKLVVHLSNEDPEARIVAGALAFAAYLPKEVFQLEADAASFHPERDLARQRRPYEAELAASLGIPLADFPVEYERYLAALRWLDVNWVWWDLTVPGRGAGGVTELVGLLERTRREYDAEIGLVILDSIDILVAGYLETIRSRDIRGDTAYMIPRSVHQLRDQICVGFNCGMFVTNQLAGSQLGRRSMEGIDHSNAGGAKDWAKAVDFAWFLGRPDHAGVSVLRLTKDRHCGNTGAEAMIRLDGRMGHWADVRDRYVYSDGLAVPKDEFEAIAGPRAPRATRATKIDPGFGGNLL